MPALDELEGRKPLHGIPPSTRAQAQRRHLRTRRGEFVDQGDVILLTRSSDGVLERWEHQKGFRDEWFELVSETKPKGTP